VYKSCAPGLVPNRNSSKHSSEKPTALGRVRGFNDAAGSGAVENEHGSGDSEDENSAGANDLKFGFIVPAQINQKKNIVSYCLIFCRGGACYHQAHHRSSAASGRLLLSAVQGVGESGQRFDPVAK